MLVDILLRVLPGLSFDNIDEHNDQIIRAVIADLNDQRVANRSTYSWRRFGGIYFAILDEMLYAQVFSTLSKKLHPRMQHWSFLYRRTYPVS